MSSGSAASFDVIVWGATGFTGKLVSEYLCQQYGCDQDLKWAIAGRDRTKLETVRDGLGQGAADLPILVGDAGDADSLSELVRTTRVVCSTVGPYSKYGEALVAACAKDGVHYCDIAGEPHFIREMIDRYHLTAQKSGARIVSACGFDSIPSDLGVYFLNREALARWGEACSQIQLRVAKVKGGFSGGTAASILEVVAAARKDRRIAQILSDPYSLNPPGAREGLDGPDRMRASYDSELGSWVCPFIMAGINTKVVRRSHALRGFPFGRDFRYDEATMVGPGLGGRISAYLNVGFLALFLMLASFSLSRRVLRWVLPKSGEGPSRAQREAGCFELILVGTTPDGRSLRAEVVGDRDPGYGGTSRMLGESAVCLAQASSEGVEGGVLTPAFAMAEPLLERLEKSAGLHFRLIEG